MDQGVLAGHLCRAVYDGDTRLLRRLLHAGVGSNCFDYDRRTALHVAAAEGNLAAVKVGDDAAVKLEPGCDIAVKLGISGTQATW